MSHISDRNDPRIWDHENAVLVNIQLLNSLDFSRVTKLRPPPTPITREQYRQCNISWYEIYEDRVATANTKVGQTVFGNLKTIEEVQPKHTDETQELVITLPASLTYTRENRITAMFGGYIIDQFLDKNSLSYSGTTK